MEHVTIASRFVFAVILSERSESKDLRTCCFAVVKKVRRFFDFADAPLRMTQIFCDHRYKKEILGDTGVMEVLTNEQ